MKSSYIQNHFGDLFKTLVKINKPKKIIEFGCLEGYSASCILAGLKENGGPFDFTVYDLFENYAYNHAEFKPVSEKFPEIKFIKMDYYKSELALSKESVDFMHIDISNTGETYRLFTQKYFPLLSPGGIAVLEGGSMERDNYEWMVKYNKPKIVPFLQSIKGKFNFIVLEPFPSVTVFVKN